MVIFLVDLGNTGVKNAVTNTTDCSIIFMDSDLAHSSVVLRAVNQETSEKSAEIYYYVILSVLKFFVGGIHTCSHDFEISADFSDVSWFTACELKGLRA